MLLCMMRVAGGGAPVVLGTFPGLRRPSDIRSVQELHRQIVNASDNCLQTECGSVRTDSPMQRGAWFDFTWQYKVQDQQTKRKCKQQLCHEQQGLQLKLLTVALQRCVCVYWDGMQGPQPNEKSKQSEHPRNQNKKHCIYTSLL